MLELKWRDKMCSNIRFDLLWLDELALTHIPSECTVVECHWINLNHREKYRHVYCGRDLLNGLAVPHCIHTVCQPDHGENCMEENQGSLYYVNPWPTTTTILSFPSTRRENILVLYEGWYNFVTLSMLGETMAESQYPPNTKPPIPQRLI